MAAPLRSRVRRDKTLSPVDLGASISSILLVVFLNQSAFASRMKTQSRGCNSDLQDLLCGAAVAQLDLGIGEVRGHGKYGYRRDVSWHATSGFAAHQKNGSLFPCYRAPSKAHPR